MKLSKEEILLRQRSCEAILLGFKPVIEGYAIPDSSEVCAALGHALEKICGNGRERLWWDAVGWTSLRSADGVDRRVMDGLKHATYSGLEKHPFIYEYLHIGSPVFDYSFFERLGLFYRFKPEAGKAAKESFRAYWDKIERKEISKIHGLMREYVRERFFRRKC